MTAKRSQRIRPLDAYRAWKKLSADPDRTEYVFEIISALSGRSGERQFRRFAKTDTGRRILAEERDLLSTLSDREALRALPEGSLGHSYAAFMDAEQISADGLVDASESADREHHPDPHVDRFFRRLRDAHDVWHVVSGYGRDLRGEATLLSFTFAQERNPGIGFIVAMIYLRGEAEERRMLRDGYRRGKQAAWLPAADWEALLPLPLDTVREQLEVGPPPVYEAVRSEGAPALA